MTQNNTDDSNSKAEQALPFSALIQALPEVAQEIQQFALERDWSQYHTPRNLILALLGEVGELAELVQWKGDDDNGVVEAEELEKFSQELADVTIYLLRLATVVDVVGPLCEQMLQLQGK